MRVDGVPPAPCRGLGDESAREQAGEQGQHAIGRAGDDDPVSGYEALVASTRDPVGRAGEKAREVVVWNARAGEEGRRNRTRTERADFDAFRSQLAVQGFAERDR